MNEPLIFTAKGNLPVADLQEKVVWTDTPEQTTLAVEHWLGGECVKRAVHIYKRSGLNLSAIAGGFNG